MKTYKHYSFGLWSTLIRPNPYFKIYFAEYLHDNYNPKGYTKAEIFQFIRTVDDMGEVVNEKVGRNIDSYELMAMVLYKMGVNMHNIDLLVMYNEMEEIFFSYPPALWDDNTLFVLLALRDAGATLSILSNTGFIKGYTLDYLLIKMGIFDLFSFRIYADQTGCPKPSMVMYNLLLDAVASRYENISLRDILHVGDNPVADFKGASDFGIDPMLINSNDKTIIDVLNPTSLH